MRVCVVCGARVTNLNPKCNTCDPLCTRAKYNGVSREAQAERDIEAAMEAETIDNEFISYLKRLSE